jgi:hypothetical protein
MLPCGSYHDGPSPGLWPGTLCHSGRARQARWPVAILARWRMHHLKRRRATSACWTLAPPPRAASAATASERRPRPIPGTAAAACSSRACSVACGNDAECARFFGRQLFRRDGRRESGPARSTPLRAALNGTLARPGSSVDAEQAPWPGLPEHSEPGTTGTRMLGTVYYGVYHSHAGERRVRVPCQQLGRP